jgi:hypothetical protein
MIDSMLKEDLQLVPLSTPVNSHWIISLSPMCYLLEWTPFNFKISQQV